MPKLNNWSMVLGSNSPYQAPEQMTFHLHGTVTEHPRIDDGKIVRTSYIVKVDGKIIETVSGSIYELGEPSKEYLEWLEENNIPIDLDNPIKVKDLM